MKKTTLLLKQSIQHWQRLVDGVEGERIDVDSCAVCREFFRNGVCKGCPVSNFTGKIWCQDTPYTSAAFAFVWDGPQSRDFKRAAKEELEFLKSLLPKVGKKHTKSNRL